MYCISNTIDTDMSKIYLENNKINNKIEPKIKK